MARYATYEELPGELKAKLARYFTNPGGRTFCITGLPSELTGGALARYSRAKTGMQLTIINEFLDENGEPSQEKGSALMDRVLNAFGDESVGELEGAHVGIEDVSQLLTKEIEDRRIGGSPIEQSTRYVKYDEQDAKGEWRYVRPREIMEGGHAAEYVAACDQAFTVYAELIKRLSDHFKQELPRSEYRVMVRRGGERLLLREEELENEEERKAFRTAYAFTIRCAALDVGRCVLPASTKGNVGLFGNGRFFTNLLSHLKSSPLAECRERAEELEAELKKVIPTFIKRNARREWVAARDERLFALAEELLPREEPERGADVTLAERASPEEGVVTSVLYPYTSLSYAQVLATVKRMGRAARHRVLDAYKGERRSRRDRTGRALEAGYPYTFDLIGTYAEYRDLQRHRMLTQQRQLLGTSLGFFTPPEVRIAGMESEVAALVARFEALHERLQREGLRHAAQYATLFNHRIRWLMGMNLRELQHLTELRSQPQGHYGYRAIAMMMARLVIKREPWTARFLQFVDYSDPGGKIARAREQARIQGKNLERGVAGDTDL